MKHLRLAAALFQSELARGIIQRVTSADTSAPALRRNPRLISTHTQRWKGEPARMVTASPLEIAHHNAQVRTRQVLRRIERPWKNRITTVA